MLLISHVATFPIWRMSQSWPTQSTLLLSQACNINPCIKDCRGEQNEGSRDSCSNLGGTENRIMAKNNHRVYMVFDNI